EEPIDEHGGPATHVDDSPAGGRSHRLDQLQRQARLALVPAHPGLAPGRIDPFPVGLAIDGHHVDTWLPDPSTGGDRRNPDHRPAGRGGTTELRMISGGAGISMAYEPSAVC